MLLTAGDTPDTTPPDITGCPDQDIVETTLVGQDSITVSWEEPTATDDSGDEPMRVTTHEPGSQFFVGTTTVVYTFTDGSGNTATCEFNVIVSRKTCFYVVSLFMLSAC